MHKMNYKKIVLTYSGQPCHYPGPMLRAKKDCHALALASNKEQRSCSIIPPPSGAGRRMGRKK